MQIKLFKDLNEYLIVSALKQEEIELVKKYRPSALKKQDADGNDIFAVSFNSGHPCVSANGVTFGSASVDGGYAMVHGVLPANLPEGTTYGEFIADKVGPALAGLKEFEESVPAVVAEITAERSAIIGSIVEG